MPPPHEYLLHGLRIRSEIPLECAEDPEGEGSCDLQVVLAMPRPVPRERPEGRLLAEAPHRDRPGQAFYAAVADDDGYLLRILGAFDFRISPTLDRVACVVDPDAPAGLAGVYLGGMVLAFLLGLSGRPVLHAAAVAPPALGGEVLGIGGRPGSGKTTVAALLCASGSDLVADDLLRVEVANGVATCFGGGSDLRIRPEAAYVLESFGTPGATVRETADGRLAPRLGRVEHGVRRLRAVVFPRPDLEAAEVRLERMDAARALVVLARFPRLEGWRDGDALRAQFALLGELVASTPVYLAHVPWAPRPDAGRTSSLVDAVTRAG